MPGSATKNNIKNNRKRLHFMSKKKLNSVLIQNNEVWAAFWHLQLTSKVATILRLKSKDGSPVRYVQNLRTTYSHLEPYRISALYFSSIFEAYRTYVPYFVFLRT